MAKKLEELFLYEISTGSTGNSFTRVYIFWNENKMGALDEVKRKYPEISLSMLKISDMVKVEKGYISKINDEGLDSGLPEFCQTFS